MTPTQLFSKLQQLGLLRKIAYRKLNSDIDGVMPLTVEWVSNLFGQVPTSMSDTECLSLKHSYIHNEDQMAQPEIIINIDYQERTAKPVYYKDDSFHKEFWIYELDNTGEPKNIDIARQEELQDYMDLWLSNIRHQGFVTNPAGIHEDEIQYKKLIERMQ